MSSETTTSKPAAISKERLAVGWMLDHLHGLVDADVFQHMATALHGGEMSFSQLNAIYRLYRNGPQTIAEIAQGADISHNAASRMVERLVQGGLVERHEVQSDRRQKRVELTGAGVERLRDLQAFTAKTYTRVLSDVPEAVLSRFAEVLEDVRSHLPVHPMLEVSAARDHEGERKTTSTNERKSDE
jgi:DNA-binding MarR family transcriptional regulator